MNIQTITSAFNSQFPNEPAWLVGNIEGCTYDEPFFEDTGRWRANGNTNSDYSVLRLVELRKYHQGPFEEEFFWIVGGFAGKYFCIDNSSQDNVAPGGVLMKFDNVNVCWPYNGVWFNFCTQCQDCNNTATDARGRWWKYQRIFMQNGLAPFNSSSTPLGVTVTYQRLVSCTFETDYGCEADEEDGQ